MYKYIENVFNVGQPFIWLGLIDIVCMYTFDLYYNKF